MTTITLNPNAHGAVSSLTPFGDVDTVRCVSSLYHAEPDDGATYAEWGVTGAGGEDLYKIEANTIGGADTIISVKVYFRCFKLIIGGGIATNRATPHIRTHGVDYAGTAVLLTQAWTTFSQTWLVNPNTGLAWTKAEIDVLQIGVLLACTDANKYVSDCTWMKAEVSFTPFVGGKPVVMDGLVLA